MLGIIKTNKIISILSGVALLCVASISASAAVVKADISVRGKVTVNDQLAISDSTVLSGSTITTGAESGAVIGLGPNGRVELLPGTSMTFEYGASGITAVLTKGAIRVSDAIGIGTTVTTPNAVIAADGSRSNIFSINSEGVSGSLTKGKLTVLSADEKVNITLLNGSVKSLNAGESVTQDDDDDDDDDGNGVLLAAAVGGGLAAVAAILYFGRKDGNITFGTQFASPAR